MKVKITAPGGGMKELLLREYFLNAYFIALLKQAGNEVRLRREVAKASADDSRQVA